MISNFQQEFIEEAKQVLKNLEHSLLQLAKKNTGPEEVHNVYRYLHTLKGSAGMFGFHEVERLAHELESAYSDIRDGVRQQDDFIIDLTLHAADVLADLLDGKDVAKEARRIIGTISDQEVQPTSTEPSEPTQTHARKEGFIIVLKPEATIFKRGINLPAILDELTQLGSSECIVHNESIPFESQLANRELVSWFEIILATTAGLDGIKDALMFLKDSEYDILPMEDQIYSSEVFNKHKTLTEVELQHRAEVIGKLLPQESRVEDVEVSPIKEAETQDESAIVSNKKNRKNSSVSVSTQKLDQLINVVSELVIFRSELQHLMGDNQSQAIVEAMEKLERFTLRLRDSAFNIRLVPLNILNVKLQRLIRSVSQELGKEVEFITEGLDTELDRSMINALEAPLMHIIRNAIDHGIETPEERRKRNKPAKGLLKFYSYNSGDHVFIQLQDDGNGIDFEKIRAKGIEKGLLRSDQSYSEKELISLMMSPGFSTASKVTTVSGRGVGMDVVKKEIASLRGDIEVSTEKGLGSIFTLRLPLTLTILDTLVVNVAENKYLIPINEVEYCFEEPHEKLFSKKSRQVVYEEELTPFVSLREYFGMQEFPKKETVIIINKNDVRTAVVVDNIVGKLQTVYKPLNELLHPADCFSGASILGDGTLAFILNPLKLNHN
jgi:two-component system, chemotaxis family, sensor kinase CheA